MTVEERLGFLLRSTESLHSTAQENTAQIAELGRKIDLMAETQSRMAESQDRDSKVIAQIAALVLDHERRLKGGGL